MKPGIPIKNGTVIPEHELEISTSAAGGPGGQHVNKSQTRITVRWNVKTTRVLNEQQKERVLEKLQSRLTNEGELVVHNGSSRSQQHNKKLAFDQLAREVRKALIIPKKRVATTISKSAKQARLQSKSKRSEIKKMRSKKGLED